MNWHRDWQARVYLAARFEKQDEIREIAKDFQQAGFFVTSRWLYEPIPCDDLTMRQLAMLDLEDVRNADILVLFGDQGGAGRYFEAGYAYALGRIVALIGDDRLLFKFMPNVLRFQRVDETIAFLVGAKQ